MNFLIFNIAPDEFSKIGKGIFYFPVLLNVGKESSISHPLGNDMRNYFPLNPLCEPNGAFGVSVMGFQILMFDIHS